MHQNIIEIKKRITVNEQSPFAHNKTQLENRTSNGIDVTFSGAANWDYASRRTTTSCHR